MLRAKFSVSNRQFTLLRVYTLVCSLKLQLYSHFHSNLIGGVVEVKTGKVYITVLIVTWQANMPHVLLKKGVVRKLIAQATKVDFNGVWKYLGAIMHLIKEIIPTSAVLIYNTFYESFNIIFIRNKKLSIFFFFLFS